MFYQRIFVTENRILQHHTSTPYLQNFYETKIEQNLCYLENYLQTDKCSTFVHDNRFKQFRLKLLNIIVNTNENLFKIVPRR